MKINNTKGLEKYFGFRFQWNLYTGVRINFNRHCALLGVTKQCNFVKNDEE